MDRYLNGSHPSSLLIFLFNYVSDAKDFLNNLFIILKSTIKLSFVYLLTMTNATQLNFIVYIILDNLVTFIHSMFQWQQMLVMQCVTQHMNRTQINETKCFKSKDQRLKLFKTTLIRVIGAMKLHPPSDSEV